MQVDLKRRNREEWALPSEASAEQYVVDLARSRLRCSGYPELKDVRCNFREGSLIVSGDVSSFYLRQLVYMLLKDLEGPDRVVDRMTVCSPESN